MDAVLDPAVGPQDFGPLGDLTPEQVAAALIPDIVTIDFSQPVQFTNGRQLTDDVIDVALQLVLNRTAGITDAIDANDVPFLSTFPYLAPPHQPAAEATPTPTPTAGEFPPTGGQGPTDGGDGLGWPFFAALSLGSLLVVTGAGVLLRRRLVR